MAAITGATTTTSLTELIPAEQLAGLGSVARAVPIADFAAFPMNVVGSNVLRLPRLDDAAVPLSEASGKTETDEFAATEQTASEASVTAATVGIRKAPSDELKLFSPYAVSAELARDSMLAMMEQMDEDVLTNITSAANTSNFSGLNLTIERLGAAIASLRLRNGPGSMVIVLHETPLEDLKASHRAAGLGYGLAMTAQAQALLNANARGIVGSFEGAPIAATTEVPIFDGSNHASAIIKRGSSANNSGLAWAFWQQMVMERDREVVRKSDEIVTSAIYGTTLVRDDCIQELVTAQ